MNLDDAREKIMYAGLIHDSIPAKWKSKLITDNKFELGFSNGSRIITMFKPRGKGPADVYIDEMALMPHADDIYDAALYMISRGGQLSIASTPFGKGGRFYDIISNNSEYPDFKRYQLPWWWSSALCIDVKKAILEAPSMRTPDRVDKFGTQTLKLIFRNNTIEGFMQEMELSFIDEQEAFLSYDLIMRCVDPNPEYLYFNKLDTFINDLDILHDKLRGVPYAGYDVGRRKHPAVLEITEKIDSKHFLRASIALYNKTFEEQEFLISQALDKLPIPKLAIDETGMGMQIAENLAGKYPGIVIPVNFGSHVNADIRQPSERDKKRGLKKSTIAVKERMATDIKIAMQRGDLVIPPDKDLILQLHSIKAETSITGNITYAVEKNETHHADKFWSLGMCLLVSRSTASSEPTDLISYGDNSMRNNMSDFGKYA
jgi:phage FluMu gp28-like protein